METSRDLIPSGGVHITEAQFPAGFYVAKYDADGFTSEPRWFQTKDKAVAYAARLVDLGKAE